LAKTHTQQISNKTKTVLKIYGSPSKQNEGVVSWRSNSCQIQVNLYMMTSQKLM